MYVNNHLYDRLTTVVVGQTWPAHFYDWIADAYTREIMQQIAQETEEDYQQLITTLNQLGVNVLRPDVETDLSGIKESILKGGLVPPPPMCPTDWAVMVGNNFYESISTGSYAEHYTKMYSSVFEKISINNTITSVPANSSIAAAFSYQFNDRVFYSKETHQTHNEMSKIWKNMCPEKTISGFHQIGHLDGWFCPVTPGLIISAEDSVRPGLLSAFYQTHFKDSKVVFRGPSLSYNYSFQHWQKQHSGHWWVPGQEKNSKFIDLVDGHFKSWVGDVSETVFDVNMIVVDDKTAIIRETVNQSVIKEIENTGVTVYQVPFRHSIFWDAGLHCVTLTLDRNRS
jgi:N-dimethylarginine dimethylaminohydrolase